MSETRKIRLMLVGGILFLFSGYASCIEIKYMIWGQSADAEVVAVRKSLTSGGRFRESIPVLGVRYQFKEEDGTPRENIINMKPDWEAPSDGLLKIDYLSGKKGESRMHGEQKYGWIVFFFGSTGLMTFLFIRLVRQGYD